MLRFQQGIGGPARLTPRHHEAITLISISSRKSLDLGKAKLHYQFPMARKLFTEQTQRGYAHAVLGMPACLSGQSLIQSRPACAGDAEHGNPGMSW